MNVKWDVCQIRVMCVYIYFKFVIFHNNTIFTAQINEAFNENI